MSKHKKRKTKGGPPKPKASDAKIELRVQAILQLKLDGAEPWNILQYAAEKQALAQEPWVLKANQKPLSERQLREYMARADALLSEASLNQTQNALHLHLSQRRGIYARAMAKEEFGIALAVLQDLARLGDLYPAPKKQELEHTGRVAMELVHEIVTTRADLTLPDEEAPHDGNAAAGS